MDKCGDIVIFTPEIRLNSPHDGKIGARRIAEGDYIVYIDIMERRMALGIDWLESDHEIGYMSAYFKPEDTSPYKISCASTGEPRPRCP